MEACGDCMRGVLALLVSEAFVMSVVVLAARGRPVRADSPTGVASSPAAFCFPLPALESGCMLSSFNVWMGISATPIIIEVAVPIKALAPPEMGSTGPSSIAYSLARYLFSLESSLMLPHITYSLSSEKLSSPCCASTVAAWALSLTCVRLTLQTAGSVGVTAHRNSSYLSI
jgi:hypothetical protein